MKEREIIEDWVDGAEVRALAEKLMAPAVGRSNSLEDSFYGEAFEGFDGPGLDEEPEALPTPVEEKVVEPMRGEERVLPPMTSGGVQRNPFQKKTVEVAGGASGGGESGRVSSSFRAAGVGGGGAGKTGCRVGSAGSFTSFVLWLRGEIPLEEALIKGGRGEVLFDDMGDGKLSKVAHMLAGAAHRKGGSDGRSMLVKLGPKRVMQVVVFEGSGGASFAGLVLPRPLADGGVAAFVKALKKAME